eukprot:6212275-Pleurochrysis_carterae.AAC.1
MIELSSTSLLPTTSRVNASSHLRLLLPQVATQTPSPTAAPSRTRTRDEWQALAESVAQWVWPQSVFVPPPAGTVDGACQTETGAKNNFAQVWKESEVRAAMRV